MQFIDLKTQYQAYREEIQQSIDDVLKSAAFVKGPALLKLSRELAHYIGVKHALPCSNGTDALIVALKCLGIGPGDEVIVPVFSFFATAAAVCLVGAKPVFVDIEEQSYNLATGDLESAISDNTKAILPVSLYGQTADMKIINQIASKHGLVVIEDAAQSFGATYHGWGTPKKSCGLSTAACTSFYPAKALGGYGEGGAVFTHDDALAEKMGWFIDQGQSAGYVHEMVGFNARLDTLQAAILRVKLRHYDDEIAVRRRAAQLYTDGLSSLNIPEGRELSDHTLLLPRRSPDCDSIWTQYTIRIKNRDRVRAALKKRRIPTAVHYPKPINKQPAFEKLGYATQEFPVANRVSLEVMSLPIHGFISDSDVNEVIKGLVAALR